MSKQLDLNRIQRLTSEYVTESIITEEQRTKILQYHQEQADNLHPEKKWSIEL